MLAQLLAVLVAFVLNAPPPARLDDPARSVTGAIPEGRVLFAEVSRGAGTGPQLVQESLGPTLRAEAFLVLDLASGSILVSRAPSAVRPVASLTKILTAVTVIRHARPDDVVTVSRRAVTLGRRGSNMGLLVGEQVTVRDLLAGLLIPSANDAAVALAEHVSGTEAAFAKQMETVGKSVGLSRTRAENATGFDTIASFSSAYDVSLLLAEAWQNETLGNLLRTEALTVTSVNGRHRHRLNTTNRLLGVRTEVLGGKTGSSPLAEENLAVVAESPEGHPVIAIVLGSTDRFAEMDNLLNWTFWAYQWSG